MKHFVMLLLVLVSAGAALGQNVDELPTITTSGYAEISVSPDTVTISLEASNLDLDLETAKSENDKVVGKISEVAARHGVEEGKVRTSRISVDREYEYVSEKDRKYLDEDGYEIGQRIFKGFEVSKSIEIELGNLSKFEALFGDLLLTGLSEVNSVSFTTSRNREFMDQAREMAMKASREKASAMASAVGQSIGKAVKIVEGNVNSRYLSLSANSANVYVGDKGSEDLAEYDPGSITISATVTVHFLLD